MSLWDGLSEAQQGRLGDLMLRTGELGRQTRWKSRRVEERPIRQRRSGGVSLSAFVYRYDDAALRDWEEAMGGATLRLLDTEPAARRRETRRVQREYLSKVLQSGRVYSLPGDAVDQGGAGAQAPEFAFFQLVHARAGRQKTGWGGPGWGQRAHGEYAEAAGVVSRGGGSGCVRGVSPVV